MSFRRRFVVFSLLLASRVAALDHHKREEPEHSKSTQGLAVVSGAGGMGRPVPDDEGVATAATAQGEHPPKKLQQARYLPATTTIFLDFEDLDNRQLAGNFYNGDGGPNYGIVFGPNLIGSVDQDAGGSGPFANEPSPNTTLWLLDPSSLMSVDAGFTGLSFKYSGFEAGATLSAFDGPNATGSVLATAPLQEGGKCSSCGDPTGNIGVWFDFSLQLSDIARSMRVSLTGTTPYIDNLEIALVQPTQSPTLVPSKFPSAAPTKVPTEAPTKAPTKAPATTCSGATYWVYNAATNAPVRRLRNNSVTCLVHSYNVEVRPCANGSSPALPVTMKLVRTKPGKRSVVVRRHVDAAAPFFLFGDSKASGDVFSSPGPLPNGKYRLIWSVAGGGGKVAVAFVQACPPCPKGKKGCRKK